MSLKTAYYDSLRKSRSTSRGLNQDLIRDPTPEEWKRTMNEYYVQQAKNRYNGSRGRK